MAGFDPAEYTGKKKNGFDPKSYASDNQTQQGEDHYIREPLDILANASENLVPFGAAIHHKVIDPIVGHFTGETPKERLTKRETYERYLQAKYPRLHYQANSLADAAGAPLKGESQLMEPYINQVATHPETVGFNPQTAMSAAPMAAGVTLPFAAGLGAKAIGGIKARPAERASLKAYAENPAAYDSAEKLAGGKVREKLVNELQDNIKEIEDNGAASKDAMGVAKYDKGQADANQRISKQAVTQEQRGAISDTRDQFKPGVAEGDAIIQARKDLETARNKSAQNRNAVLDKIGADGAQVNAFKPYFENAKKKLIRPEDKANVDAAWADLVATSEENSNSGRVSARQIDDFRQKLQSHVPYDKSHKEAWHYAYNNIARDLNNALDEAIPVNNPLRKQVQADTLRYNKADDLFGGDYPLARLQKAIKEPMMRRDLEDLNIPSVNQLIKNADASAKFEEALKNGIMPKVKAEDDLAHFTSSKEDAIKRYLQSKQEMEQSKALVAPMSSKQVEPTLNSAMVANEMHPRVNQNKALTNYAENIHPQGPEDFYGKYKVNKVLRDLSTMDTANGSRMVNLGKSIGKPVGGAAGLIMGHRKAGVHIGEALGASAGAALDYGAGGAFRNLTKMSQQPNILDAATMASTPIVKYIQRLQGTPYASQLEQAQAEDPQKAAILHYMLSSNDPNYAKLIYEGAND